VEARVSIGDTLAQARSQAGLTIGQVGQRTRIRDSIIRDIERGDFSTCGGDFYARGHIRSIARAVGIDPEPLILEYDATHGAPRPITAADVFEPATPIKLKERRSINWTLTMAVVLVVVLGYGVYRAVASTTPSGHPSGHPTTSQQASVRNESAGHPSKPQPAQTVNPYSHTVVIQVTTLPLQDCWVEFLTPSGLFLKQALIPAGATQTWRFHRPVVMKIGNPPGIRLTIDGRARKTAITGVQTLNLGPGQALAASG
jgi:cytoskeletal protein RodZ